MQVGWKLEWNLLWKLLGQLKGKLSEKLKGKLLGQVLTYVVWKLIWKLMFFKETYHYGVKSMIDCLLSLLDNLFFLYFHFRLSISLSIVHLSCQLIDNLFFFIK